MNKRNRFIQSILRTAEDQAVELPWQRVKRRLEDAAEAAEIEKLRASA
ncbi:hypothetical protein [Mesobacterium pallidum]|nr:hypothetical protein [Mesobacterium pallidum]